MEHDDPRVRRSRTAIIEAATALFVEGGIAGVTIEAVASTTGIAKTTIYRHWPTRHALLLDVFRQFDHRFRPAMGETALERLQDLARQLAATLTQPDWSRALPVLLDVVRRHEEFAELHESGMPPYGVVSQAIADLVAEGAVPPDTDPGELFVQIVGPLTMGAIFEPARIDAAFADRLVLRLVHGAAAERATNG